MISNLEEIAKRFFMSKGYLVAENVLFFVPREKSGKKVSGWSDIDLIAYKKGEIKIVQCKEFLGTKKISVITKEIKKWFELAEEFLKNESDYKELITSETEIKRCIVVNSKNPPGAIKNLEREGFEIYDMDEMLKDLIHSIKSREDIYRKRKTGASGKELDIIRYLIKVLIDRKFLNRRQECV